MEWREEEEEGDAEQSVKVEEPREKEEELVSVMESAPPFPPMHLH